MPVLHLVHYTEHEIVGDVLRLFYGKFQIIDEHTLQAGSDATEITIGLEKPLEHDQLAGVSPEACLGTVFCRMMDGLPKPAADANVAAAAADPAAAAETGAAAATGSDATNTAAWNFSATVPANRVRREIKRQLYLVLENLTDVHFPWGSLTGIRPTQIAWEVLQRLGCKDQAAAELIDYWRVLPAKADLALRTAVAEQQVLEQVQPGQLMVYVGIPFCPSRCSYCSFIAQDASRHENQLAAYVEAIITETRLVFERLQCPVAALYIGGGTPTSLHDALFERLLTGLARYVPLAAGGEYTVEAGRPDTITPAKLELIRQAGANRLCINPQTMHDETLVRIGRHHDRAQTLQAFAMARQFGFHHINMDLITGLPGETPADFADSLEQLLALSPESITVHTLALKRSARLQQNPESGLYPVRKPDPDLSLCLQQAQDRLDACGYAPYYLYRQKEVAGGLENTGFAKPGQACLYNVGMMSDRVDVIGLGSGAMTKRVEGRRVSRSPNAKDLVNYLQRVEELVERKLKLF